MWQQMEKFHQFHSEKNWMWKQQHENGSTKPLKEDPDKINGYFTSPATRTVGTKLHCKVYLQDFFTPYQTTQWVLHFERWH